MSTTERVLDWRPRFDERSRLYPVRAVIGAERPRDRNKMWRVGPTLDQAREGACVGFGWTAEALSTPVPVDLQRVRSTIPRTPDAFARSVYRRAQQIDEWEGERYEGTSVLAGAKALTEIGLVREYRWAFGIYDVIDAILAKGPVVLGIEWREGMYDAPGGILRVSGSVVGGHCLLAVGRRVSVPEFGGEPGIVLQNSWGQDWGNGGLAVISESALTSLLARNGEACIPTRRSYGR